MAYRLRMPAEIGDWLAELAGSAPEAAAEVGAALLALMQANTIPGPPLVRDPGERGPAVTDPRERLDNVYHQLVEHLQLVRREVADTTTLRSGLLVTLAEPDLDPDMRAALDRQLGAAQELETVLSRRAHRLQVLVDAFRGQKETAKALATAAEAQARVQQAVGALEPSEALEPGTDPDPAEIVRSAADSAERIERLREQAMRLLGLIQDSDGAAPAGGTDRPESDVLELRPDPLGSDVRILFAEEPTGTVTLLTVLADTDAVDQHASTAVALASELLEHIRDEGWPTESLQFEYGDALVARYLPGRSAELKARAAVLTAAMTLAGLRERLGLTARELADRAGLDENLVTIIEQGSVRHADVETLAAFVRALGGTLRVTASVDGTEYRLG
jgi:DNA-binding Xre family transcriptional regulator